MKGLRRRHGKARAASDNVQIVIAKLYDDFEVVQAGRVDLGERHKTREVKQARAAMWKRSITPEKLPAELAKAEAFASREGYDVFVYPSSERDSLDHAKRDCLTKHGIGSDVGRIYHAEPRR